MTERLKAPQKVRMSWYTVLVSLLLVCSTALTAECGPLTGRTIGIDPGHGGGQSGAVGWDGDAAPNEKHFNLDVALKLRNLLQRAGAGVVMTRTTDVELNQQQRVEIINAAQPDILISIHCNSTEHHDSNGGTETYWHTNGTRSDQQLAHHVQDHLVAALNRPDRGVKQAGYAILGVDSSITGVLAELLFIDNQQDFELMNTESVRHEIADALRRAVFDFFGVDAQTSSMTVDAEYWLRTSQKSNGSWSESTGITALVLMSFFNAGYLPDTDAIDTDGDGTPDLQEGMSFLAAHFDSATGSFYGDGDYRCYDTALCMLAFISADRGSGTRHYQNVVTQAKNYLISAQYDDNSAHPDYGGWGYPTDGWADLSNTQWVVMALDAAYDYLNLLKPSPAAEEAWASKLLQFLDHCQRADGGFDYKEAWWSQSAGSMSMAGLWSLLLAGLHQPEARIADVQNWIGANYSLDLNPGRDPALAALYYYYVSLAKALTMAGWSTITDSTGTQHDWFAELKDKLETLQHEDGYWVNSNTAEWEDNPDLCTAYALLALQTQQLPTGQQLSWVLTLHSPGDLHVYDPDGRHVGIDEDGGIDEDIPGSSYEIAATGEQIITLTLLQAGTYRIEIVGTGTGSYTLESEAYQDTLVVSSKSLPGNLIPGQVQATTATLTSMEGALTVFMEAPQAVPSGLMATPGNAVVEVSWNGFQESGFELAGYNVYRSTASHAGYAKLNNSVITSTSYNDTGLVNDTTYYYAVTAVSTTSEETPYSREVAATPRINQSPSVEVISPTAGEAIAGASVQIKWEATDVEDAANELAIDLEFSRDSGTSWAPIASGQENDGSHEWSTGVLVSGESYVIRVTATDTQNASASATSGVFTITSFSGTIIVAPNPATGEGVVFFYALPEPTSEARLLILSVNGSLLFETRVDVESHRYPITDTWNPEGQDGISLANGPYLYVLLADGRAIGEGKMVIQR